MSPHAARPRFFYGWLIVAALSLTETTSWGILYYGFAVYLPAVEAEMGWTRTQTTGAFSLALLLSGLMAIPVGRWLDRHGARVLMSAGSLLGVALVLAWSRVADLGAFYLVWAGIGLSMAAVLYDPALTVLAHWFSRERRRAFTVLTFAAGLASLIFNPLNAWLIQAQGWRAALVTAAAILAVLTVPVHILILRRRPADLGLLPDGENPARATGAQPAAALGAAGAALGSATLASALRTRTFWLLNAAIVLLTLASITITVHLIPYLLGRGYDAGFAALSVGLIGGMQLPGRLAFLPLGRRLSRRAVIICVALLQSTALVVLLLFDSLAGVLLFVALFGMASGMATLARATLVVEFFGPAYYGSINGWVGFFATLARAVAPLGAALLYTAFAGYTPVLWVLVVASLLAALCFHFAETALSRLTAPDHTR